MTDAQNDAPSANAIDRRRLLALTGTALAVGTLTHAEPALARASSSKTDESPTAVRHVDVNGATLAYRRHGRAGLPPLLLIHGYALYGTGPIYQPLITRLTSNFEVWAMDLRGHGGSAASVSNWSQATIADDVAGFAEKMNLRGAVYAGHSLGGFTGLYAQIRHPGTFSALALLATAAAGGNTAPPGIADVFARDGQDKVKMSAAFKGMYMRPRTAELAQAASAVGLIDPAVHRAFYPHYAGTIITDRLKEIDVPVLLLSGARDNVVAPLEQHHTAAGLARSKEVVLSGEGHMLPIERPEVTARELATFFLYDTHDVLAPS